MKQAVAEPAPSNKPKAVREVLFFELEFIAVNGREVLFNAVGEVLAPKGIEVTRPLFVRHGLAPRPAAAVQALLKAAGKNMASGDPLSAQAEAAMLKAFGESAVLNKGLAALIKAAQQRQIQAVAVSAWPEKNARELFEKLGLDQMGVELAAFDSNDPVFPRADHWLRLLKQRGQEHLPMMAVVSSRAACKGALTAGATVIAVPDAFTGFQDFTGAKVILDSVSGMSPDDLLDLAVRPLHV